MAGLEEELLALQTMQKAELKGRWAKLTGHPVPKVSAGLMRLARETAELSGLQFPCDRKTQ